MPKANVFAGKSQRKVSGAPKGLAKKKLARRTTLGELIAATFETVGTEVKDVARLLTSPTMTVAINKRIVVV